MPQNIEDIERKIALATEEAEISIASTGRTFVGVDTNISVRSEFGRSDYEYYRNNNKTPKNVKDEIEVSMNAYKKVGQIRNVIDLMSDFAVQGVRFVHENKSVERFCNRWFEHVDGYYVSERFLNLLYRAANVPVYRIEGKIPSRNVKEWKAKAESEDFSSEKVAKRQIPVRYSILNPSTLDVLGGTFSTFVGNPEYVLRLPSLLNTNTTTVIRPNDIENLLAQLPPEVRTAVKNGQAYLPLPREKFQMFFYKKDDWLPFARPMLSSLIDALIMLEKMHLADLSALDGAISQIRLWKLGFINTSNVSESIIPTRAAINKLRNMLHNNTGGGVIDLVWGPDIDFKESSTNVHQFLGDSKYKQVMSEIYGGLGIPSSLTGEKGGSGGFTNNFISMKTLMERLRYGREILKKFWMGEMRRVQKAIGFAKLPVLVFDHMSLSDESSELNLLMGLVDRNIISEEAIRDRFEFPEDIELSRIRRQQKQREEGKIPPKASPYHNAHIDDDIRKIILQSGGVAPSEIGFELQERAKDDDVLAKRVSDAQPEPSAPKKREGEVGRPKNAKDQQKRKQRTPLPRTGAFVNYFLWANNAQAAINEIFLPGLPGLFGKNNLRQLTTSEKEHYENLKFRILCNLGSFEKVDAEKVYSIVKEKKSVNPTILEISKELVKAFTRKNERLPNTDELRQIQSSSYAYYMEENQNSKEEIE